MDIIVAYTNYSRDDDEYVFIEEFENLYQLTEFIVEELSFYPKDIDEVIVSEEKFYNEDGDEVELTLEDLISELENKFQGDGSYGATMLTIQVDGRYLFMM